MQSLGTIKRGDTFAFTAGLKDAATGDALTGAAGSLRCQGREYMTDNLITELVITETETLGIYLFATDSTDEWCPGSKILFDIQYSSDGKVSSTETFSVDIESDVTHD